MTPVIDDTLPQDGYDLAEQIDSILIYTEISAGALMEINWSLKFLLILYIIFGAWRVVRK